MDRLPTTPTDADAIRRALVLVLVAALITLSMLATEQAAAEDFGYRIPLAQQSSGALYIEGQVNDSVSADFLLDTGSGMVTVGRDLFSQIKRSGPVEKVGRVAARLANGRLQPVDLYLVQRFRLGEHCEIGPLEVAVMPGKGRNILGMSALSRAAPFAVHMAPPSLAISSCDIGAALADAR